MHKADKSYLGGGALRKPAAEVAFPSKAVFSHKRDWPRNTEGEAFTMDYAASPMKGQ